MWLVLENIVRVYRRNPSQKPYTLEWHGHQGTEHRWAAYPERQASDQLGRNLERLAATVAQGLPFDDGLRDALAKRSGHRDGDREGEC